MIGDDIFRDDRVLPFQGEGLDVRGRVVRLGPAVDTILRRHAYPDAVSRALAEATALTLLLGTTLKFEGRFILQTRTDGPVRMIVVDFQAPDGVRACATFDRSLVAAAVETGRAGTIELLGRGHLAMTIDQGGDMNRYQGLVALDGGTLEDAAHEYFQRSEQIPTRVRLAVAEEFRGDGGPKHSWRAGGILLQFVPRAPERARVADLDPGDAPEGVTKHVVDEDDAWVEGRSLIDTVEDIELIDPEVSSERLLYRLFHERGVRVFNSTDVHAQCSCSRDSVEAMLRSFPQTDRDEMVENGVISVTCEFCSQTYVFQPDDVADGKADGA
jgi:molecular chaperone Hsp33